MFPVDNLDNWHSGKGYWCDTTDAEWNDWKWQLRNRIPKKNNLKGISKSQTLSLKVYVFPVASYWFQ